MKYEFKIFDSNKLPTRLRELPEPPKKLFVKGELPSEDFKWLAVVGSRKFTPYGREVCQKIISGLSGYPVVIVSGLALGIDSIAHKTALDNNIKTVAVPGSGLSNDCLYPSSNKNLAHEIVKKGGALLSEYEPDFRATTWSFPRRNRIMAGLSDAVLVIEAELPSGTLVTSRLATEYNRDVLAVPGSILSTTSAGPHMLIRNGATPITSPDDVLEALGLKGSERVEKNFDNLNDSEKMVVKILETSLPKDILIAKTGLSISEANSLLTMMEIKGIIKESGGEFFVI